jgi:hypothetical protein
MPELFFKAMTGAILAFTSYRITPRDRQLASSLQTLKSGVNTPLATLTCRTPDIRQVARVRLYSTFSEWEGGRAVGSHSER